jgi:hypothetical protein
VVNNPGERKSPSGLSPGILASGKLT